MIKQPYAFLLFLAAFFLQSTVLIHVRILGVTPNLILCLVAIYSFFGTGFQGAAMGILFGLVQDVCFGVLIGVSAMGYFLAAIGILLVKHLLYQDNIISIFVVTLAATLVYNLICWGILYTFQGHYHFIYMAKTLPMQIIWNGAVTGVYYMILGKRLEKNPGDRFVR